MVGMDERALLQSEPLHAMSVRGVPRGDGKRDTVGRAKRGTGLAGRGPRA